MTCFGKDDLQGVNRLNHRLKTKKLEGKRLRKELDAIILAEVTKIWTWSLAVGMEGMSGSG
jgi:hypothetical protein